ncbi:MAG: uracil-DNA glycosylase [Comamonadaceae bacterium]|nr:MAG: uracil-DNA glycosylase [Comamonadaceae bacterium]
MSLQLDARQRAMLAEMGLRLFDRPAQGEQAAPLPEPALPPARPVAPRVIPVAPESIAPHARPISTAGTFDSKMPAETVLGERPAGIAQMDWEALAAAVAGCRACRLCESRRNTVFGTGDLRADWLIVGEAPGENEDLQGEPFVGQAGKLLDNMLKAIGLDRHRQVYIANVLKCRPPGNRNPEPAEVAQCEPYLARQVALLQPRIILAMGRFAVQSLLQTTEPIGKLRGRVHQYAGVPVIVTYHPAYLLRNLPEKAKAWADLCLAMDLLDGKPAPV